MDELFQINGGHGELFALDVQMLFDLDKLVDSVDVSGFGGKAVRNFIKVADFSQFEVDSIVPSVFHGHDLLHTGDVVRELMIDVGLCVL